MHVCVQQDSMRAREEQPLKITVTAYCNIYSQEHKMWPDR